MNVLSLFDGMSCGQIALNRIGIKPTNYYASELDKYAIKVTQANYPDTIQLGDVTKWREWDIDWASINLLIGGSPCQGFSFAGKQLAFDDPRSKLFFVYVDILNHIRAHNPGVKFMLENVKMKKEYLNVISEHLGVEPVFINSALVSAQNRQRYYWANWEFGQPEDRGIVLADVIQSPDEIDESMYYGKKSIEYMERGNEKWMQAGSRRADRYTQSAETEKAFTLTANFHKGVPYNYFSEYVSASCSGRNPRIIKEQKHGKALALTANYHKGLDADSRPGLAHKSVIGMEYKAAPKCRFRKLTPIECERLQTVPDNYTAHVSNTQRYKMIGNGWTVDVIAHIFRAMPCELWSDTDEARMDVIGQNGGDGEHYTGRTTQANNTRYDVGDDSNGGRGDE